MSAGDRSVFQEIERAGAAGVLEGVRNIDPSRLKPKEEMLDLALLHVEMRVMGLLAYQAGKDGSAESLMRAFAASRESANVILARVIDPLSESGFPGQHAAEVRRENWEEFCRRVGLRIEAGTLWGAAGEPPASVPDFFISEHNRWPAYVQKHDQEERRLAASLPDRIAKAQAVLAEQELDVQIEPKEQLRGAMQKYADLHCPLCQLEYFVPTIRGAQEGLALLEGDN